jgi:hypothetical protein
VSQRIGSFELQKEDPAVARLFQQADPVALADSVDELRFSHWEMLAILDGVARQADIELDATRRPALLNELQLPVADVKRQLERLINAQLGQHEGPGLRLEPCQVRPGVQGQVGQLDAARQPERAAHRAPLLGGDLAPL